MKQIICETAASPLVKFGFKKAVNLKQNVSFQKDVPATQPHPAASESASSGCAKQRNEQDLFGDDGSVV